MDQKQKALASLLEGIEIPPLQPGQRLYFDSEALAGNREINDRLYGLIAGKLNTSFRYLLATALCVPVGGTSFYRSQVGLYIVIQREAEDNFLVTFRDTEAAFSIEAGVLPTTLTFNDLPAFLGTGGGIYNLAQRASRSMLSPAFANGPTDKLEPASTQQPFYMRPAGDMGSPERAILKTEQALGHAILLSGI